MTEGLPTWTSLAQARRVRSPCVFSSANCAASLASVQTQKPSPSAFQHTLVPLEDPHMQTTVHVFILCNPAHMTPWCPIFHLTCNAAWPQAISNGQRDVILCADVQDLIPVGVCKILHMVQQAQLRTQKGSSVLHHAMQRPHRGCTPKAYTALYSSTLRHCHPPYCTQPKARLDPCLATALTENNLLCRPPQCAPLHTTCAQGWPHTRGEHVHLVGPIEWFQSHGVRSEPVHVLHTFAWMEPPRDTMPVRRFAVSGMCLSSTPAWMVK